MLLTLCRNEFLTERLEIFGISNGVRRIWVRANVERRNSASTAQHMGKHAEVPTWNTHVMCIFPWWRCTVTAGRNVVGRIVCIWILFSTYDFTRRFVVPSVCVQYVHRLDRLDLLAECGKQNGHRTKTAEGRAPPCMNFKDSSTCGSENFRRMIVIINT